MPPTFLPTYPYELGVKAPEFRDLKGVDGRRYSLSSFSDKGILVLVFMANRCPTARVYMERMNAIQRDFGTAGVQMIAINSDDVYLSPAESFTDMVRTAQEWGMTFPYLKDEDKSVGRSYGALVTLHTFALDRQRRIRYRGRIDDSRDPAAVTRSDLREAIGDLLGGREVAVPDTRPFACMIEYG